MRLAILTLLAITVFLSSGCSRNRPVSPPVEQSLPTPIPLASELGANWLSIASADVIIRTRLDFPGKPLKKLWNDESQDYRMLNLPVIEVLKCEPRNPWSHNLLRIRPSNPSGRRAEIPYWAGTPANNREAFPSVYLEKFKGQEVILSLHYCGEVGAPKSKPYLFLSHLDPVQPWSPERGKAILASVAAHEQISARVRTYLSSRPLPLEKEVLKCIEDLMHPDRYSSKERDEAVSRMFEGKQKQGSIRMSAPEPLARLEELGMDAVPAIIKYLDDTRGLPKGETGVMLDIHDHPNAWEGVFHASAVTVAEILHFALMQITLDGAGDTRGDAVRAAKTSNIWRSWLVHSGMLAGMEGGKTPTQSVLAPRRVEDPEMKPAVFGNKAVM